MTAHPPVPRQVVATVHEVLPRLGLAYVTDDEERCWGITRSSSTASLDELSVGSHVRLTIEQHRDFAVASAWVLAD